MKRKEEESCYEAFCGFFVGGGGGCRGGFSRRVGDRRGGGAVVPAEAAPLFAAGGVLGQPVEVQGTVIIPVLASLHGGSVPLGVLVVKDGQVSVLMEESGGRFAEALSRSGKGGRGEAPRMKCADERSAKGASGEAASGKKCSMKSSKGEDA